MTKKSPDARSPGRDGLSSPQRSYFLGLMSDNRNNETSMFDALTSAHERHESVRERALRVFEMHELREQQRLIEQQMAAEEKRIKEEKEAAERERKLNDLKKTTVPKPPPPAPEPALEVKKESEPAAATGKTNALGAASAPAVNGGAQQAAAKQQTNGITAPQSPTKGTAPESATSGETKGVSTSQQPAQATANGAQSATQAANPFAQTKPDASAQPKPNPFAAAATPAPKPAEPATAPAPAPAAAQPPKPSPAPTPAAAAASSAPAATPKTAAQQARAADAARYVQIHQNLKELRKNMLAESKKPGSPLKGQIGSFRREIRTSIGQLTGVKGANAQPTNKVISTLTRALKGEIPSPLIDVTPYIVRPRNPVEGAPNNEQLPSLFIYLLNIAAKGIISQFINECSANPKAADPIGVFTAQVFSNKEFSYRGDSLIDILIAKFRVVCPVLFGFRGNDRTEKGRISLGWRKDGGSWIPEQAHNDRMTGLGAGFASVALRDFSRASRKNPFPPTNYWVAFADIVNTPLNETSNTQYVVLRALIEGHEKRFLSFYGNAALAALRLAFVEFPKRAPGNATAAGSLKALAEVLKNEGMVLG